VSECRVRDSQQTARDLRETVRNMAGDELARVLARLPDVDEAQRREMEELLRRVVGKVLHQPLTALRAGCRNGNGAEAIAWTRRLFGLDG
jgi:glutamyl-tRNA reductase